MRKLIGWWVVLVLVAGAVQAQTKSGELVLQVLNQGKDFFQKTRYQDALANFREVALEPTSYQAEGSFWVVKAQLALNRLDEAQVALEGFITKYPKDPNIEEALYQRARILYLQADLPSAVKAFTAFLEKFQNSTFTASAYYWMGESLLSIGQLDEARKMFAIVVKDYPTSFKAEAAGYKQSLIDQKSREEQLLNLLKWSHQENIKNIEDFNRKEQAYQEAIREYQRKLTNLAPQDFKDELRQQQQRADTLQSQRDANKDRIDQLNAQLKELQVALQKAQDDLQKANTQLAQARTSQGGSEEALEQRRKLLDAKEEALKLKEQALLNLEQGKK